LIGAAGGVAATVALGVSLLRRRQIDSTGLVTRLSAFEGIELIDPGSLVIGGHEVRGATVLESVRELHARSRIFRAEWLDIADADLRTVQRNIRPGTLYAVGPPIRALQRSQSRSIRVPRDRTPFDAVERLAADILAFRKRHRLHRVIVINLASSEPPAGSHNSHARWTTFRRELTRDRTTAVPTSALYALAAFEAGCPYINFTPSPALAIPAVRERAAELGLPYMGNDGKTGETLVKSALAPMFAMRNLRVHSWIGQNLLGNRDGAVLSDPATRASKIRTKDGIVARIVGGKPATSVSIEYVPSLDDWKIAWDLIHFGGFLGTNMTMQFTWQGCDSALAAPLVVDLARLAELEWRRGEQGPMSHLAFFFKDPIGATRHDLSAQWDAMIAHVTKKLTRPKRKRSRH
jgi:myo-inositol-1-phosphate synthase